MSSLTKLFESVMGKKSPDAVVGLDIGSAFIKAVQLHKKGGKAILDTYGEIALGPIVGLEVGQSTQLTIEQVAQAVNDLFREAKITSRDVVISLPLTSTLLTVIELPDLGEAKLKEMIPIEARKYIPTSVSEVSLNWWIIPKMKQTYVDPDVAEKAKQQGPKVDVLLAAVHNDVIERYKVIAEKIGSTSVAFEIEIFSAIRAALGHDTALSMVVDLGAQSTKVVVVENGVVRSSQIINAGGQDVTLALARSRQSSILDAEELKREYGLLGKPDDNTIAEIQRLAVERILGEIGKIYAKYERDKHVVIPHIYLIGGAALLKGVDTVFATMFPQAKVDYVRSFAKVESPAVLTHLLDEAGPEFAVSLGLAFRRL